MNIGKRIGLFITAAALTFLGAGCSGTSSQTEVRQGELQGTLSFEEKNPERGILRGTYDHQGYRIRFDVVRGEPNPPFEVMGGAPKNAIDARLCDEVGFCFARQAGGHGFADSSWVMTDEETERLAPDDARARKNNAAMWALHQDWDLMDRGEFEGLSEEYDSFWGLTNIPPNESYRPDLVSPQSQNNGTPQRGVLSFGALAFSGFTNTHRLRIWWKPIVPTPTEHSSTTLTAFNSSGTQVNFLPTCNHGTCGGQPTLGLVCSRSFSNRPLYFPVTGNCNAPAVTGATHSGDGCCPSPYGFGSGQHVCHDDTRLQRDMMIAGGGMSVAYCGDGIPPSPWAPGCN